MKLDQKLIRLNKYIAQSGLCSRRKADEFIESGVITVNGKTITDLGFKIHNNDKVAYKGKTLTATTSYEYLLFNKPKNCITTLNDEKNRETVVPYIQPYSKQRLVPVGRLDRNTTGLLLFTNDGDLHHDLLHPSSNIDKVYKVRLNKKVSPYVLQKLAEGTQLEDGHFKPDDIALLETSNEVGVQIHSGRNRIVRRYFESFDFEVLALDRVTFAGLSKYKLPRGKCRFLVDNEVRMLKRLVKSNSK